MENLKNMAKSDPIKRNVENGLDNMKGCTPFDPPSSYDEDHKMLIPADECSDLLKMLIDEHKEVNAKVEAFEKALVEFKSSGFVLNQSINQTFSEFFRFYDQHLLTHNEKEEKVLFPLLNKKLIENGEHSVGENPATAIDVMEDDHLRFVQLGTLTFNLFGLATRIRDAEARSFVCDSAYNCGRELTELIKLHVYREDYTLFPLAHKLISAAEFEAMLPLCKKYKVVESNSNACAC